MLSIVVVEPDVVNSAEPPVDEGGGITPALSSPMLVEVDPDVAK